ncbi:MAG: hypothetical protein AAGC57_10930 [Pseudomonadota bacterium]
MLYRIGMGLALCMAACAPMSEKKAEVPPGFDHLRQPGCYTVDLFKEVPINQPAPEVPAEHAAFLGEWGNGVWNGKWCHDLLIHTIHADGRVELLDMHAPTNVYGQPATIFKRIGQIREDGALHFAHGVTTRSYRIIDGLMHGTRDGSLGTLEIVLSKKGVVPLPIPRPIQLAQAGSSAAE